MGLGKPPLKGVTETTIDCIFIRYIHCPNPSWYSNVDVVSGKSKQEIIMYILKVAYNVFKEHHNFTDSDPRMNDLPLVSNIRVLLAIVAVYLFLVLKVGPAFMKYRSPYEITGILHVYNFTQILINLYAFAGAFHYIRHPNYSWFCMNVERSDVRPETMALRKYAYMYFISKLLDLLETVFFVLRKKYNQISFLHLYHHVMMIYGATIYLNFFFGSHFTIVGIINSVIHVVMYIYYTLAARKQFEHSLAAWKPRMTELQILQFLYIAIKLICALANNTCGLPTQWLWLALVQNGVMIGLFSNFYWRTYILKPKKLKQI